MIWIFRKSLMTIPSELHEKVARSCTPINAVSSEVVGVRHRPEKKAQKRQKPGQMDQDFRLLIDNPKTTCAIKSSHAPNPFALRASWYKASRIFRWSVSACAGASSRWPYRPALVHPKKPPAFFG